MIKVSKQMTHETMHVTAEVMLHEGGVVVLFFFSALHATAATLLLTHDAKHAKIKSTKGFMMFELTNITYFYHD